MDSTNHLSWPADSSGNSTRVNTPQPSHLHLPLLGAIIPKDKDTSYSYNSDSDTNLKPHTTTSSDLKPHFSTTTSLSKLEQQQPTLPTPLHSVFVHHSLPTQHSLLLAHLTESLSVGLGLGSAVGIWAVIREGLFIPYTHNIHLSNWICGLLMGFVLAPFFEKAARIVCGRAGSVLLKPASPNWQARMTEHAITIPSAFIGLGVCKAIQAQYPPFHTSVAFEYLVFVVGFTFYSFVKTTLYTVITSHEYEGESVKCPWTEVPSVIFWEYLDHFHHVYVVVTVMMRDFLTFAIYPYMLVLWVGWWEVNDVEGRWRWVMGGVNIGFFFSFFSLLKEITYLVARGRCSEDMPHHRHHGLGR